MLAVFFLLSGMLALRSPEVFTKLLKNNENNQKKVSELIHYYPYQAPEQPQVLGATSIPDGPSIIGDDGTIQSVADMGEVLGASTEDLDLNLDNIKIKNSANTDKQSIQKYIAESNDLENQSLDTTFLEQAMTSKDQKLMGEQIDSLNKIIDKLYSMEVPEPASRLHKIKILHYQSALHLLKNIASLDDNPDQTINDLSLFASTQSEESSLESSLSQ